MSIVLESLMWPQEFEEAGCPTPSSYNCMTPPIKNSSSHKQKYLRSIKTYIGLSSFRILFDNLYKNNNRFFYQKRCHSGPRLLYFLQPRIQIRPKKSLTKEGSMLKERNFKFWYWILRSPPPWQQMSFCVEPRLTRFTDRRHSRNKKTKYSLRLLGCKIATDLVPLQNPACWT